jgi:hypothetical protein
MLNKFRKMIYAFDRRHQTHLTPFKQHSRPSRSSSRPSSKSCQYRNPITSSQCCRNLVMESGHLRRNPVSPDFGDYSGRISAIWPKRSDSGRLAESGQKGQIPTSWPDRSGYSSRNSVKVA